MCVCVGREVKGGSVFGTSEEHETTSDAGTQKIQLNSSEKGGMRSRIRQNCVHVHLDRIKIVEEKRARWGERMKEKKRKGSDKVFPSRNLAK